MSFSPLPIDSVLAEIVEETRNAGCCVIKAPTGAGKTTRVPSALADGLDGSGLVILVEPRRLAARSAAARIAFERNVELGREVGYRVRFDNRSNKSTRILVATEGILVRMLQRDPFLEGVQCLVFDEFHERNLDADLALAMAARVRAETRPELALVVMSATLDVEPISRWLDDAPVVDSPGRLFPVEHRFLDAAEAAARTHDERRALLKSKVVEAIDATEGHILVFLPGVPELKRLHDELEPLVQRKNIVIHELFGDLSPTEQDRALAPSESPKVILATNVAETSVTIEGVTAVIDTGLAKRLYNEPGIGLDRLRTERISRASADQRAGRAGRTGPGIAFRLWTQTEDRTLERRDPPEIARVDLASSVLELAAWGEADPTEFPWFEAPPPKALDRAGRLLRRLGALQESGRITPRGKQLAELPVHPRLARLILAGKELGIGRRAALVAALLSERSPFRRTDRRETKTWSHSDVQLAVEALEDFENRGLLDSAAGSLQRNAARGVLRVRDQVARLARLEKTPDNGEETALSRAILSAFPDRVCRRRANDATRAVMVGGSGVRLAEVSSVREAELFVAVETRAVRGESLVQRAVAIDVNWLNADLVHESIVHEFSDDEERVITAKRTTYEDLVLVSKAVPTRASDECSEILLQAARTALDKALDWKRPELASFMARVQLLRDHCPELELPKFDEREIMDLLPELCAGKQSFAELRRTDLEQVLRARLEYGQSEALRKEAPESLTVPSGSKIRLVYAEGRPPVLAVRIQEVFGWSATPRVARGRVPVLMHLLAPNMRPQQVTDDLESFWNGAYLEVRKELRRRYPKHAWPEDPWSAEAVRGVRRRKPQ